MAAGETSWSRVWYLDHSLVVCPAGWAFTSHRPLPYMAYLMMVLAAGLARIQGSKPQSKDLPQPRFNTQLKKPRSIVLILFGKFDEKSIMVGISDMCVLLVGYTYKGCCSPLSKESSRVRPLIYPFLMIELIVLLIEFPDIRSITCPLPLPPLMELITISLVDYFRRSNDPGARPPLACFLTHIHRCVN